MLLPVPFFEQVALGMKAPASLHTRQPPVACRNTMARMLLLSPKEDCLSSTHGLVTT